MNGLGKMSWCIKMLARHVANSSLEVSGRRVCSLRIFRFQVVHSITPYFDIRTSFRFDLADLQKKEGALYVASNDKKAFFNSTDHRVDKL